MRLLILLCVLIASCSQGQPIPQAQPPPAEDYAAKEKYLDACMATKHFMFVLKGIPGDASEYCRCILRNFYAERICNSGNCEGVLSEKAINILRGNVEMRIQCGEF